MASKLYTTYAANLKAIPEGVLVFSIMQMPLAFMKKSGIPNIVELSPNSEIFVEYRKDKDWNKFEESYKKQMYENPKTMQYINFLIQALDNNDNDICLVCCEKDNAKCHRRLIAEYIASLGYTTIEL